MENGLLIGRPMLPNSRLPYLIVPPATVPADLLEFGRAHRARLSDLLQKQGALLLRGFGASSQTFGAFVDVVCGSRLNYSYRSTPRTTVSEKVFTSTIYPANREILLHSECAYQEAWPLYLAFCCVLTARRGGETPLADLLRVSDRIGPELMAEFRQRGVRYIRNYRYGVDIPWTEVFQTQDRAEVQDYCNARDIQYEWLPDDGLRTAQTCQGTAVHPYLRCEIWFNQAHLFHVSSVGTEVERFLIQTYGARSVPRNAFYGDGSEIGRDELTRIRNAFEAESVTFPWMNGDVLLVDNMQVAHGRRPYIGDRSILVAMSTEYSSVGRQVPRYEPVPDTAAR